MTPLNRIADKAGTLGSNFSAFGCAACFPAIASIGATIVLGLMLAVSVRDLVWT